MTPLELIILAIAASLTAALSAVAGMGGGTILLGVMTAMLPSAIVIPIHGVVQMGSNTSRTLIFLKSVRWSIFWIFLPGLLIGITGAAMLWTGGKMPWFKQLIGIFLLFFLLMRWWKPRLKNPPMWIYFPVAIISGFLTLFVGATGPFIAPFFLREDLEPDEVIATKAICQSVGHLLKIPTFLALGFAYGDYLREILILFFAVIIGTVIGKRLLSRLSKKSFSRIFIGILILLGLFLLIK
jgi:uncharacterized membrane protein YfcA